MTSEVALLNRSAVALAADSAATVRQWRRDHYETYYFKGANKIFQLSAAHPVGIMIYATASLQGAPWDVLIKSYRDHLGNKSHDTLSAYADDLFDYITNNTHIFGLDFQEQQFKHDADIGAAVIVAGITSNDTYKNAPDDTAKVAATATILTDVEKSILAAPFVGNATQTDIDDTLSKYSAQIEAMLNSDTYYNTIKTHLDMSRLARLAIIGQYKEKFTNLNNSGIVVAGFGDKDYFPGVSAYNCYGLVLGKLIHSQDKDNSDQTSQNNGSGFASYAQDDMMRSFMYGISASSLADLEGRVARTIDDFYDGLVAQGIAPDISGDAAKVVALDKLKNDGRNKFDQGFIEYMRQSHVQPFRSVLGSLPFDELAQLAETLVLLESLKERVTRPSASVSGPIDVAVISKNDGFIWIKRKHYFDPKLNPRFFAKRGLPGGVGT